MIVWMKRINIGLVAETWKKMDLEIEWGFDSTTAGKDYSGRIEAYDGIVAELRPLEQRYWRLVAERKGVVDERMLEFRWLLEELRVSFFAQELRTPQPVSVKRLDKAWAQLG